MQNYVDTFSHRVVQVIIMKQTNGKQPYKHQTLRVPIDLIKKYETISKNSGLSVGWLIRRAMNLAIKSLEHETAKIG